MEQNDASSTNPFFLTSIPDFTVLLVLIFTACEGRAVELAATAVNVALLHLKEFFRCCVHYRNCSLLMFQLQRAPLVRTRHLRLQGREQPRAEHLQGGFGSGESGAEAWWSACPSHPHRLFLGHQTGGEKVQLLVACSQPWRGRQRPPERSGAGEQRPSGRPTGEPRRAPLLCGVTLRQFSFHLRFVTVEPPRGRHPGHELHGDGGQGLVGVQGLFPNVSEECGRLSPFYASETHCCNCSTVNTLGVLTGKLLLGMTKEEIRTVCPEEGSKVFFHLQSVKSAMAVSQVT